MSGDPIEALRTAFAIPAAGARYRALVDAVPAALAEAATLLAERDAATKRAARLASTLYRVRMALRDELDATSGERLDEIESALNEQDNDDAEVGT